MNKTAVLIVLALVGIAAVIGLKSFFAGGKDVVEFKDKVVVLLQKFDKRGEVLDQLPKGYRDGKRIDVVIASSVRDAR